MKKFQLIFLALALGGSTLFASAFAQAQILDGIRNSIRNLWGQKSSKRESARQTRAKAQAFSSQAEAARFRLKKAQQLMIRSNAVYQEYSFQAKQTEARIVRTRHRVQMVTSHYKEHQAVFGARLASIQRNGQISYLNMLLGSRTLSDLSRRMYLYQAIAERDADLQEAIKDDKYELEQAQNVLMSQWQQRHRLLQAATRERSRLILAQNAQERTLKAIKTSVYSTLAEADARAESAEALDREINELESQRVRIISAAREEREREYSSYRPRRRARYEERAERRTYRRRYRRYRRVRTRTRRTRREYVRTPSGELKRERVKDTAYEDVMVPEQSGDELGESFESESGDDQAIEPWTPPASE